MGCGNQPVFTDLKEGKDECDLTNKPSGAGGGYNPGTYSFLDDIMSVPFVSPGYEQFPACNIQGDFILIHLVLNCKLNPIGLL